MHYFTKHVKTEQNNKGPPLNVTMGIRFTHTLSMNRFKVY